VQKIKNTPPALLCQAILIYAYAKIDSGKVNNGLLRILCICDHHTDPAFFRVAQAQ
jgi:hypothetical protein